MGIKPAGWIAGAARVRSSQLPMATIDPNLARSSRVCVYVFVALHPLTAGVTIALRRGV